MAQGDKGAREFWWQFIRPRPELNRAISKLDSVLVVSRVADVLAFTFLPSKTVYSEQLVVFAEAGTGFLAVLQSRVHEGWARFFGSSMKDDLRYTPSDCFEAFPFPANWEEGLGLDRVGREYYDFRARLMRRNNEGLTKTYNRFYDPDERDSNILLLRELHEAMDRAVLEAYGWTDIQPRCEFILDYEDDEDETPGKASKKRKPWRYRWPDPIRDEVLGRLLELNAQRAKDEVLAGAGATATTRNRETKTRSAATPRISPLLD